MKRISALSVLLVLASMFIADQPSAADLGGPSIRMAAHRAWPTRECYIWGYYGWREPYCGAMGGFYYPWGASYYLAPQRWGRKLFRDDYGFPYD
jgi:hypothetical protein